MDLSFYKNRKVFITGHTGFKGAWMCEVLSLAGAEVTGYALEPPTEPALFNLLGLESKIKSVHGDIRDLNTLSKAMAEAAPEIVIHMAAQPIVRESYVNPVYTYETNVMGTVNICEAVRQTPSVKSFINVTTDKVYLNREWDRGYRETDELNGYDPYSNSKSCSELVTSSYIKSFFTNEEYLKKYGCPAPAVSTCRAGNVIGGGDFAKDRIIPDCIRAVSKGEPIGVRNPNSVRPYQHVLEPVMLYLKLAEMQYENKALAGSYNIGPCDEDCLTTGELVKSFCDIWNEKNTAAGLPKAKWLCSCVEGPHEANFLKLDCQKVRDALEWAPVWKINRTIEKIVEWNLEYLGKGDVRAVTDRQISEYLNA